MNTDQPTTTKTASARPENVPVSWTDWRDLLTLADEDKIALEVGLIDAEGNFNYTPNTVQRFDALCDFRRSMKLFHHYAKQVNP